VVGVVPIKKTPGLRPGEMCIREKVEVCRFLVFICGRSELANWIETNVSRRAGINAIGRQQAVVPVGTEQALR